jgi:hypothetical protein
LEVEQGNFQKKDSNKVCKEKNIINNNTFKEKRRPCEEDEAMKTLDLIIVRIILLRRKEGLVSKMRL